MQPTKELRTYADDITAKVLAAQKKYKASIPNVQSYLRPFYKYEEMLAHVLMTGRPKYDRTGTGTWGVHGYQLRFNIADGFPLTTTKKTHMHSITVENLWFLKGDTNIGYLKENNVSIWDEWADENGDLGPVYGKQWRNWETYEQQPDGSLRKISIDQIADLIDTLKKNPQSRRMIVNAWNVGELKAMALTPCHCMFQFHTSMLTLEERRKCAAEKLQISKDESDQLDDDAMDEKNIPVYRLDLQLYQRSCDIFLGVPFNIASYAMLLLMVAQVVNMVPGEFIHDFGDLHIYQNHLEQVVTQLSRVPYPYPTLKLNPDVKDIFAFKYEDFMLENYQCHPALKAKVAV